MITTTGDLAKGWSRYCSNPCRHAARWGDGGRQVESLCTVCGAPVSVVASRAAAGGGRYCSVACRGQALRRRVERTCETCGSPFERAASTVKRGGGRFCTRACATVWRRNDTETAARVREMQRAQLRTRNPTRCEITLYELMDDVFGDGWERQCRIGTWTVDAAVPALRLVVQADGDYWHGREAKWRMHRNVARNVENDRKQARWMKQNGWTLLRFWETDLKADREQCRAELSASADAAVLTRAP